MPYRRRFRSRRPMQGPRSRRRRTRRSRYRRSYGRPTRFGAKQGSRVGIPNQILIKLREARDIDVGAGTSSHFKNFALTATSLANLGTLYLTELRGMYSRYLVCACKFTVYWTPESDSPPSFLAVQAITGAGDEDPTTYEQALAQNATKVVRLPIEGAYAGTRPILRMYRKSKYVFAVKDLVDNRDYSSVTEPASSGPTTQWRWSFTVGSVNGLIDVTGRLTVVRDFYTKFYQRKDSFSS